MLAKHLRERYPAGRKHCLQCKRWRHLCDFSAHERTPDGLPRYLQSRCKTCDRINQRVKEGMKRRGRPYGQRKSGRQTREEIKAQQHKRYQERMEEIRSDPEVYATYLETERIKQWDRRRRLGIPVREFRKTREVATGDTVRLPVTEEFKDFLRRRDLGELADLIGMDRSYLDRLLKGYYYSGGKKMPLKSITLHTADRILTYGNTDLQLHDFWPDV